MTLVPVSHLHFCFQWFNSAHQHIPEKGCSQTPRCLRRDAVAGGFCCTSAVTWIETIVTNSLHSLLLQHGQELPFRSSILGYLCYFSVGTLRIDIHRYPALVFHFSMLVRCRLVFKYSSNLRSCSAAGFALIYGRSGCGGTQPRDTGTWHPREPVSRCALFEHTSDC